MTHRMSDSPRERWASCLHVIAREIADAQAMAVDEIVEGRPLLCCLTEKGFLIEQRIALNGLNAKSIN